MSLRKFLKRAGRKASAQIKRTSRQTAPARARIGVYATGVVAAAASYFFTPVAGAAVTALGGEATRYAGATAARSKGKSGKEARDYGRKVRKRAWVAGAVGTTAGGIAGAIAPLGYGTSTGVFGIGAAPASTPVVPQSAPGIVTISGDALPTLVSAPVASALPSSGAAAAAGGLTGVGWLDTGLTAVGGAALSVGGKALGGLLGGGTETPPYSPVPQNTPPPYGGMGGAGSDVPGGSDTGSPGATMRAMREQQQGDNKTLLYLAAAGLVLAILNR